MAWPGTLLDLFPCAIFSDVIAGMDILDNKNPTNCACSRCYIQGILDFSAIVKNSVLPP